MAISDLMMSGVELMLLGMGIVFMFLTILVFTLKGMCALAAWLEGTEVSEQARPPVAVTDDGANDPVLMAVISAAVKQYRISHNA